MQDLLGSYHPCLEHSTTPICLKHSTTLICLKHSTRLICLKHSTMLICLKHSTRLICLKHSTRLICLKHFYQAHMSETFYHVHMSETFYHTHMLCSVWCLQHSDYYCCTGVCSCQMFHYSACDISQTCFNRGVESVVVPKTSATSESGWIGLAKYAWSGYVRSSLHCTLYS